MNTTAVSNIKELQGNDYIIQISNMHKWYGDFHVLPDINLDVKRKERIVICGPSGSGKSTALDPEMIKEVLDVMIELAREGMTMLVVTHEMGFAKSVAHRVLFMDEGQIVEQNSPDEFFDNPQNERTKLFLSQILH